MSCAVRLFHLCARRFREAGKNVCVWQQACCVDLEEMKNAVVGPWALSIRSLAGVDDICNVSDDGVVFEL